MPTGLHIRPAAARDQRLRALANSQRTQRSLSSTESTTVHNCTLFVVGRELPRDPLNRKHYHVAVRDEDLCACQQRGFLVGPSIGSDGRMEFPEQQMTVSSRGQYAILVDELTHDNPSLLHKVPGLLLLETVRCRSQGSGAFLGGNAPKFSRKYGVGPKAH